MPTQAGAYQNTGPFSESLLLTLLAYHYVGTKCCCLQRECLATPLTEKLSTDLVKHELNIVPQGLDLGYLTLISRQMSC